MAIYNEILAPRYSRFIQKLLSMKGIAPMRQLAGEMSIAFPLFNGRENRFLEGWQTFGARASIGAVAAQDSVARFQNPAGSGNVAVIEGLKMWFNIAAEAVIEYSTSPNPNLANVATPANFDNRSNAPAAGNNGAQAVLSITNNVAQGTHFIFDDVILATANNVSNEIINYEAQEIQLLPGSSLQVRTLTLNVFLAVMIRWRERTLEDSEKFG